MLKRTVYLAGTIVMAILMSGIVGVGRAEASSPIKEETHARVSLAIVPKAIEGDQNLLAYDVVAANHSDIFARNVTITVPFDSTVLKVMDVKFSGGPAWLQKQDTSGLVFSIERLHMDHPTTATLTFAKLPHAPQGAGLTERAIAKWTVLGRSDSAKSNLPIALQQYYPMSVTSYDGVEGLTQRFAVNFFVPGEPVTFWCNMPGGEIHGMKIRTGGAVLDHKLSTGEKKAHSFVNAIRADENGIMSIDMPAQDLGPGTYSIVAYGNWSGLTAVGPFVLK